MLKRAERLYRLRALHRRRGRGPSGDVLRLFLFLADGWGWEHVRDCCVDGLDIALRMARKGIANRIRGEPTAELLREKLDDIAADQYAPDLPTNQAQINRVGFIIGVLLHGEPLTPPGTIGRLIREVVGDAAPKADIDAWSRLFPFVFAAHGLTAGEILCIARNADDDTVRLATIGFCNSVWLIRRAARQRAKQSAPMPGISSNLLTMGGRSQGELTRGMRNAPYRITPGKVLGGAFAQAVIAEELIARSRKLRPFLVQFALWCFTKHLPRLSPTE